MHKFYFTIFLLLFSSGGDVLAEEPKGGEELYQLYCSACHSLSPPPKAAPPFRGIIRHYYERYAQQDTFVAAIQRFVNNPDEANAVCRPAVNRFGLMPKLPVSEEQVRMIATWLWENKAIWPKRFRTESRMKETRSS